MDKKLMSLAAGAAFLIVGSLGLYQEKTFESQTKNLKDKINNLEAKNVSLTNRLKAPLSMLSIGGIKIMISHRNLGNTFTPMLTSVLTGETLAHGVRLPDPPEAGKKDTNEKILSESIEAVTKALLGTEENEELLQFFVEWTNAPYKTSEWVTALKLRAEFKSTIFQLSTECWKVVDKPVLLDSLVKDVAHEVFSELAKQIKTQ